MSVHSGVVDDVFGARVPDTGVPAQKVIVNVVASDVPPGGKAPTLAPYQAQVAFFIPRGVAPERGEAISWDAGHAWWIGEHVKKLSWEMNP